MSRHGVRRLVFSSSATVYGEHAPVPMQEDFPTSANNPYGWTKVMQEQVFRDAAVADPRPPHRPAPLLQPGRRARLRDDRRGPGRHPEQPDADPHPGRRRPPREAAGVRRRLPDARRHRTPRLPARRGPRRRSRRRARAARHHRRAASPPGTSAPAARPRSRRCSTRSPAPAATTWPYEIAPRRPGDIARVVRRPREGARRAGLDRASGRSTRCAPTAGAGSRRTRTATRTDRRTRGVAEDAGFEPARAYTQPAFQASAIGH